jgi:hypothetical protein
MWKAAHRAIQADRPPSILPMEPMLNRRRTNPSLLPAPLCAGLATLLACAGPSLADRIENQVAVFAALDKVTARISKLEVPLGETRQFGALKVTPRVCYSRPPTEPPKTTSFVEVEEILLDGKEKRLFTGWMFAESPGLNAVEHPVFDVWLTECQSPARMAAQKGAAPAGKAGRAGTAEQPAEEPVETRRRVRR